MKVEDCQETRYRTLDSDEYMNIIAATDDAGAQVIVKNDRIHLLSRPLENHKAAEKLAEDIRDNGIDVYKEWMDIKNNPAMSLFGVLGGPFR